MTWPGRDRLRHLAPLSITQLASLLADELEESVSPDAPLYLPGTAWAHRWRLKPAGFWNNGASPQGLIISGCHAPHLHSRRRLSDRDDADFIAELIDIGGCSPELQENKELLSLFFLFCALIFTLLSTITTTRSTIFRRCARCAARAAAAIVKPPGRRWRPGVRG